MEREYRLVHEGALVSSFKVYATLDGKEVPIGTLLRPLLDSIGYTSVSSKSVAPPPGRTWHSDEYMSHFWKAPQGTTDGEMVAWLLRGWGEDVEAKETRPPQLALFG